MHAVLSLLTLGEIGKSRLFIGVNADGLVGLHFNASLPTDSSDDIEVARMFYLRKIENESEALSTQ